MSVVCSVDVSTDQAAISVRAKGELDVATVAPLAEALAAADTPGITQVIVDLSAVSFMDASGIAALLAAERSCIPRGQRLLLAGVPKIVERLLAITGLDTHFAQANEPAAAEVSSNAAH